MKRIYTIDFLRGTCMLYIVGIFHLSQYLGESYYLNNNVYGNSFMWSCLGTFSLISGYLLGLKYDCRSFRDALFFYKKRIVRFYPLFILSALLLFVIGFNDLSQTVYSLIGIASFVSHSPKTLWYISMMMVFYLISPVVLTSRNKRVLYSIAVMLFFSIMSRIIYVDLRFLYNLFLYLTGICFASFKFDWLSRLSYLKWGMIIVSLSAYFVLFFNLTDDTGLIYGMMTRVLGVFAVIVVASLLMKVVPSESKIITFMSYVSMSSYLFHRFTYWFCLQVFHPEGTLLKALYLVFIAFPIGLVFAYYIQKLYDICIEKQIRGK